MANIRELSLDEISLVSGGKASYSKGHARHTLQRNAPTHIYSDPSTVKCANAVFGGMVMGARRGVPGMAAGVTRGAIKGQCLSHNGNHKSKSPKCSTHGGGPSGSCHK